MSLELQRRLAVEFQRRGWEYDVSSGRAISRAFDASGGSAPAESLSRQLSAEFLARERIKRSEATEAISAALDALAGSVDPPREEPKSMRILFVAAGPEDEQRLRLAAEHRDIRERILASTHRENVVMDAVLAARPTDLIDEINRFRPTILHLAGHGGAAGIALEDGDGRAVDVSAQQLTDLVENANDDLALVVLSSCESSAHARPLVGAVDAAIGMSRSIGDDAARTFGAQLYSSLAEGVPLGRAFNQARLQVSLAGSDESDTPVLFTASGVDESALVLNDSR